MSLPLEVYIPFLNRGDFADIYLEESDVLSIRWEEEKIESVSKSHDAGLGYRMTRGEEVRYGHTELSNPFNLKLSTQDSERLGRIKNQLIIGLPPLAPIRPEELESNHHPIALPPDNVPIEKKVDLLKSIYQVASTGPFIRQVSVQYAEKQKRIGYLNSLGDAFIESRTYLVLALTVTVERNGEIQTAYESIGGINGWELFDSFSIPDFAKTVADRAHLKLNAPKAPVGPMPVIIASSAGGTLIHEAVGHSLEADAVLEGSSPAYRGKIGKKVANEKLTVYDNPTVPGKRGSFYFDDEGVKSEATVLIDKGVCKDFMFDRLSAKRAGRKSNGHGRRESYAHPPIPRMSNTYVAPGPDDPKKILSDFKNGLLVTKMGGGQVNTANGDFVFDVEEGFHVKDGIKTLVRGATLLGTGPDVLNNIDKVGSDHGWAIGTCGKEGQGVPVSDALPTVHIKELIIGGS